MRFSLILFFFGLDFNKLLFIERPKILEFILSPCLLQYTYQHTRHQVEQSGLAMVEHDHHDHRCNYCDHVADQRTDIVWFGGINTCLFHNFDKFLWTFFVVESLGLGDATVTQNVVAKTQTNKYSWQYDITKSKQ